VAKIIGVSYSRLRDLKTCPKMFYHKHILRDCPDRPENDALRYGSYVHKAIEDHIQKGVELPQGLARIKDVVEALKAGAECCLAEPPYAVDKNWEPCQPTDWDRAWLRCKIDLMVRHLRDAFHVDWKTGKPQNSDNMQLLISSAVLAQWHPELERIEACFFYTQTMKKSETVSVVRSDIPLIMAKIVKKAEDIDYRLVQGDWPATPNYTCRYCDCGRDQCDYRR
jgi:hypothetical protein